MIRLLVVDDHTLVREGLCRLIGSEDGIEIVGATGSGREAIKLCRQLNPDVVLLDYKLPDIDGQETTEQLVALGTKVRVLILTMFANEEYAIRLIRAGAAGFLVKGACTDELIAAVRKVADKGTYISPGIMEKMAARLGQPPGEPPESSLSNRELQVLVRLARGETSREVSVQLNLSLSTIETYRSRILEKLGLRNNADISRFAIRRGLITME